MKHKAKLTISRPTHGDGREVISIKVIDHDAGIRFLDIEIGPGKFAGCLTGLSEQECEMEFRGLENVGKKIETMPIVFKAGDSFRDKEKAIELAKKNTPEGWVPVLSFDSQSSFFERDGEQWARTTASRWV